MLEGFFTRCCQKFYEYYIDNIYVWCVCLDNNLFELNDTNDDMEG